MMPRILYRIRNFFGSGSNSSSVETPEILRDRFKTRYWHFKSLLESNNKALGIMSSMEHALRESRVFGMSFVRANCTAITVNVYKMIQSLNALSSNRYVHLYDVFKKIRHELTETLDTHKEIRQGEWILPLEKINKDMADEAGGKMANLGEMKNRTGLPVPEGFVVTSSAYKQFLEYNDLQEEINRILQPLDLQDMETLHQASSRVELLIMKSPLPPELATRIESAYNHLEEKTKKGQNLSVRSSALGEDTGQRSFAGQYRSNLNVSREFLSEAYKEIVAGKYTPQAITYRLNMGFRDEDMPMCVGFMAMVDAVSSGVMYTCDPADIRNDVIVINAVWGLAKSIVDGMISPDLFVVSKTSPHRILQRVIRDKKNKFVCHPGEGTCRLVAVKEERHSPALTKEQVVSLTKIAVDLENHFGLPQDIEWAIDSNGSVNILQSRPLRQAEMTLVKKESLPSSSTDLPVLLEGGVSASPGAASGPAFIVHTVVDLLQFPHGAVLVTEHSLPQWAAALNKAAAVVTNRGGITGHLATVAREFGIPALFNTEKGTEKIKNGILITVDADGQRVYEGKAASILKKSSFEKVNPMKGSPVYHVLKKALTYITPLNLTDPASVHFTPTDCATYHDITRFCHEKSVKEMFHFGKDHHFPERSGKQLICHVPMQWWVIDLEDGFKEPVQGDTVDLNNIASIPMLALWKGITAVPWEGPPPVDARGFLSVMFNATMDPSLVPTRRSRYAEKNYFMISRHFCNLASRLGYHFSTVEAFTGANRRKNYVTFNFKGGGADMQRRILRIAFIETILKNFDFEIDIREDGLIARLEGCHQDFLIERIKVLGYVTIHTRQLDMVMADQAMANHYLDKHMKDIHAFVTV